MASARGREILGKRRCDRQARRQKYSTPFRFSQTTVPSPTAQSK